MDDENEIDLDDDNVEEESAVPASGKAVVEKESPPAEEPRNSESRDDESKASPAAAVGKPSLKDRLRLLKQKMNQARQLNRQAVQEEGQKTQTGKRLSKKKEAKADPLTQQGASQVLDEAQQTAEKREFRRFSAKDYHNPEGQYRNYQRNLDSISSRQGDEQSTSAYDPTAQDQSDGAAKAERDGARRLAQEMHRRIEKQQKRDRKRKEKEIREEEGEEVSYINKRNKHFNKKINRTYDEATAEIRQNLERGTAL